MSLTLPVYSLGAEELIELGKPRREKAFLSARKPYFRREEAKPFIGNSKPRLGQSDFLAQVGSFLVKFLAGAFSVLAEIVNIPMDILAADVDLIFTNVSSLIAEVPILGTVVAQIFLITNAVIKFGLEVPAQLLGGISHVFAGIGQALDTLAPSKKAEAQKDAKDKIMERTPDELKEGVSAALSGNRPTSPGGGIGSGGSPGATTPNATGASSGAVGAGSGLEKAIAVGALVVVGGALWLLVT